MSNDHMRNVHPDLPGGKVKSRKYRKIIFGTYEQVNKKQRLLLKYRIECFSKLYAETSAGTLRKEIKIICNLHKKIRENNV